LQEIIVLLWMFFLSSAALRYCWTSLFCSYIELSRYLSFSSIILCKRLILFFKFLTNDFSFDNRLRVATWFT
jgi:hypothetical protein